MTSQCHRVGAARVLTAFMLLPVAAASSGCGDSAPAGAGAAGAGFGGGGAGGEGGAGGGPTTDVDSLATLGTLDDYAALAAPGAEVKYLTHVDGTASPGVFADSACLFQNTRRFPYHVQFLRTFPEYADLGPTRYEDLVLRRASRSFWGGRLKLFPASSHPVTSEEGVISFTVYAGADASESLTAEEIAEVDRKLKSCAPFADEHLVWTPDGAEQLRRFEELEPELRERGVAAVHPVSLRPGLVAEGYSVGEGYGYLKWLPPGEDTADIGPRDIVVCDSAPSDLSLVAGLLTAHPQSVASHLNLRLREKGVPSASVPAVFDNALIAALADRLVHLTVTDDDVKIEPAELEAAIAFWQARQPNVGQPDADLETNDRRSFSSLAAADSIAYGTKAANLGELHAVLPPQNRLEGFAIPFRAFAEFVADNGLDAEIDAVLADSRVYVDAAHKRARLSLLRQRFRQAPLSAHFERALHATVEDIYGPAGLSTRLRFRSSTNAEDLAGLSGAGLYDSSSGCIEDDLDADDLGPSMCLTGEQEAHLRRELDTRRAEFAAHPERTHLVDILSDLEEDLTEEKSAAAALRRVWSSLWSARAFDDREYYGVDHRRVFMGVAVHPAFVGERLEAVVLTNLEPESERPLYRVVSQVGEIGVVEPADPAATPELLSFRRDLDDTATEVTLLSPSSLAAGGARLWSESDLADLAGALFLVQDHFSAQVYPEQDPLSLDIEVDIAMDGRVVLKQARPYAPPRF